MRIIILCLTCLLLIISCCSLTTISTPPKNFEPVRPVSDKELIESWQQSLIKIKEWQVWYDIQIGSNYFYTNRRIEDE